MYFLQLHSNYTPDPLRFVKYKDKKGSGVSLYSSSYVSYERLSSPTHVGHSSRNFLLEIIL